ncbi:MAG TPA: hypothetical protein VE196_07980 [Pseudonocardiaceae bacterium]|nr:hypothetical protein [Pseudonocardiaceae bacterium]
MPKPLSERMARLLREGNDGTYQSRSEAALAVTLAALNARWTLDDLRAALLDEANGAGDWVRWRVRSRTGTRTERHEGDRERRIRKLWDKAVARVRERPPVADRFSLRAELAEVRLSMEAQPSRWAGQAGPSDHAVLCVLLDIAGEALTMTPSASTRQIAERAGLAHQTVGAALGRLAERGQWVRLEAPAQGTLASAWRVMPPKATAAEATVIRWDSARADDAFAYKALGRVAARLYDVLTDDVRSDCDLSASTGFHLRTVRKHLARMAADGLARRSPGGWVRGRASLESVAVNWGSVGTAEARRLRHQREREAFAYYIALFEAKRGWAIERGLLRPDQRVLPLPATRKRAA